MRLTIIIYLASLIMGCGSKKNQYAINDNQHNIVSIEYADQSVIIFSDGSFIEGPEAISSYKSKNPLSSDFTTSIFSVKAYEPYTYEISLIKSGSLNYKQMIITDTIRNQRAFEITAEAEANDSAQLNKQIDDRRREWIKRCNSHNASDLVTQLYDENAIYFSHKPVIVNRDSLIKEYGYMNRPKYSLQLDPLHVEVVREDLVFEIGQCSGSYSAKYMLIWKKDVAGTWKILFDSNI